MLIGEKILHSRVQCHVTCFFSLEISAFFAQESQQQL